MELKKEVRCRCCDEKFDSATGDSEEKLCLICISKDEEG